MLLFMFLCLVCPMPSAHMSIYWTKSYLSLKTSPKDYFLQKPFLEALPYLQAMFYFIIFCIFLISCIPLTGCTSTLFCNYVILCLFVPLELRVLECQITVLYILLQIPTMVLDILKDFNAYLLNKWINNWLENKQLNLKQIY